MHYLSFNEYLKSAFGQKIYKLSLSGGTTCPNRDGRCGAKGCVFCSGGSGNFAAENLNNVFEEIEIAKKSVAKKSKTNKFIAYFQSYTATYLPPDILKKRLFDAASHPDIVAISVATRPDCLGKEVLEILSEVNKIKPLFVELGLQTIHEVTAEYIRRGYQLSVFDQSLQNLKSLNIKTVVHMIIGLPYETDQMIIDTARYIGKSGADGIKFHLLHVLKGTELETEYNLNKFKTLTLPHYAKILSECIKVIPKDMVVHRLTGDGDKKQLIAPLWSADKKAVLNYINKYFDEIGLIAGEKYK